MKSSSSQLSEILISRLMCSEMKIYPLKVDFLYRKKFQMEINCILNRHYQIRYLISFFSWNTLILAVKWLNFYIIMNCKYDSFQLHSSIVFIFPKKTSSSWNGSRVKCVTSSNVIIEFSINQQFFFALYKSNV